jgi:hypothetical protein
MELLIISEPLLAHGRWFSPGTPASSITKTGRHDIAESGVKTPTINQITISEHLIRSSPSVFSGAVLLNLCFSV